MSTTPSIVSEFDSAQQEADYVAWLRAKVQDSVNDARPVIPHDQVMMEMEALIAEAQLRHSDKP